MFSDHWSARGTKLAKSSHLKLSKIQFARGGPSWNDSAGSGVWFYPINRVWFEMKSNFTIGFLSLELRFPFMAPGSGTCYWDMSPRELSPCLLCAYKNAYYKLRYSGPNTIIINTWIDLMSQFLRRLHFLYKHCGVYILLLWEYGGDIDRNCICSWIPYSAYWKIERRKLYTILKYRDVD